MSAELEVVECENCGADMELEKSWTRQTIPLIGSEVEVRQYLCPDCGMGTRLQRKEGADEWERAT